MKILSGYKIIALSFLTVLSFSCKKSTTNETEVYGNQNDSILTVDTVGPTSDTTKVINPGTTGAVGEGTTGSGTAGSLQRGSSMKADSVRSSK
ncbi:hypothetical protein ACRASX_15255 [Flavobacterium sp. TMP13]|uniref:hypothetical protein n=1 Tax=Flavobacterium sp. TMP13 TaxID=3425950 RepID=UPI003D77F779